MDVTKNILDCYNFYLIDEFIGISMINDPLAE